MESSRLHYTRRLVQEEARAARALTERAKERHATLAQTFKARLAELSMNT